MYDQLDILSPDIEVVTCESCGNPCPVDEATNFPAEDGDHIYCQICLSKQ
jgi:hypothetical protein